MTKILCMASTMLALCVSQAAFGGTWYVDGSAAEFGDGSSWEEPLETVPEGIDAAFDGDTVIVAEGTYIENIEFKGKNIVLRSKLDDDAISATVIDGNQAGSVVTFLGTEDETCVLRGFTVRNGNADEGGGIYGAGLGVMAARARAENNLIVGNSADYGGGLSRCAGPIGNNTIVGNTAANDGGGLYDCSGAVHNCIISGNTGGNQVVRKTVPQSSLSGGVGNSGVNVARREPSTEPSSSTTLSCSSQAGSVYKPILSLFHDN